MINTDVTVDAKVHDPLGSWLIASGALLPTRDSRPYRDCLEHAIETWKPWITRLSLTVETLMKDAAALATDFTRHACAENIGSTTIRHIATTCADGELRTKMLAHADDEDRHSRMFAALAKHVDAPVAEGLATLTSENEVFLEEFGGDLSWFLADTHIAELRNLAILGLYVKAAVEAPQRELHVVKTLEKIFRDEWSHVSYTAPLVAALVGAGPDEKGEFVETLDHYAEISSSEADALADRLSHGAHP